MRQYICEGYDSSLRPVSQSLWAENEADAVARMQEARITVTRVKLDWKSLLNADVGSKRLTASQLGDFCRELSTMLRAGITLVRSLEVMSEVLERKNMRQIASDTARLVEEGKTLADALSSHTGVFPPDMLRAVAAAERSGSLDRTLENLAIQFEQDASYRQKIVSAMTYPAIVLTIGFAVQVVVLVYILPRFANIYHELGAELPAATQILISVSNFISNTWWVIPLFFLAVWAGHRIARKYSTQYLRWISAAALRAPIFGPLNLKRQTARFIRTFAGLYSSGVPIVSALEFAAGTLTNPLLVDVVREAAADTSKGGTLAPAFRNSRLFPPIMAEMIAIGEEAGELESMLLRAAEQCEEDTRSSLDRLTSTLEPLLMVFLTFAVGVVLIPTMLPVLTISGQVGQFGN